MSFSWKELVCHGLLKGLGEKEVVRRILNLAVSSRRYEQEEEARNLLLEHSNYITGVLLEEDKYNKDQMLEEYKREWKWRSPDRRREKIAEWCLSEEKTSGAYGMSYPVWAMEWAKVRFEKDAGDLWACWWYPEMANWYRGINEGRFFLFYRVNRYLREDFRKAGFSMDDPTVRANTVTSICPWQQLMDDLRIIDGGGIGVGAGKGKEYIDDMF